MKKFILPVLATLAVATPAMANEARVEARGGVIWSGGGSEDVWGMAAGYDFDLGEKAFAGVEVSGDKIGTSNTVVSWGFSTRLGMKAGEKTRIYANGGYNTKYCDFPGCEGQWALGAGAEQTVSGPVYVKVEYRHLFEKGLVPSADALGAGVGVRF
ncbi:outer membrane beta-barrel protein [Novosphingobium sp.]|uniref:outer membrane protein n=1 Tax=Novosphingobium sp. TaxID=1874826 RepID=UPI0025CF20FC|nr:outer membrane beta-barrel protein [Novosphingobium sp.]MCC6925462.1 outer membrane beta-barrel protein [Novosphingobium sp.]